METLHPVRLILPSTSIAETTSTPRTGDSGAMRSGGKVGFERPDRIGVAVRAIPPITLQSSSDVAEYEVVLFPVLLYLPDATLFADDQLSGEVVKT
jgi:hypothetical protein